MEYNHVELLAPAGKWKALEKVVAAGADAVYLGGKKFNMRLLRPDYNFSEMELREAVSYLHQHNKRLYVTINSLYYDEEIAQVTEYLQYLEDIEVDAIIVQDTAIINLHQELGLRVPLHASVQMGIGSAEALKFLGANGVKRVVLSKNLTLEEISQIHQASSIDLEYFIHGDLCISHTGQCLLSSLITGESGNRGQCIKPCRWKYTLAGFPNQEPSYYLAHKDLCLYSHLKAMIKAGISSFKIEGRMRDGDYLAFLVDIYRKALDRIIYDQEGYESAQFDAQKLHDKRIRDFSTAGLYGRIDLKSIGLTGEREPFFASSARVVDKLKPENYLSINDTELNNNTPVKIRVKVADCNMLEPIINTGVSGFILGYEYIRQHQAGWDMTEIRKALEMVKGKNLDLIIEIPRIVNAGEMGAVRKLLNWAKSQPGLEIMVNEFGSMKLALDKGLTVSAGPGFNIINGVAARFFTNQGIKRITASAETNFEKVKSLLRWEHQIELMVHGPLYGMVTDLCLAQAATGEELAQCTGYCCKSDFALIDEHDQHYYIRSDSNCRNYIYYPYDLCLFPFLNKLYAAGIRHLRLDMHFYNLTQVIKTVTLYCNAIEKLQKGVWQQRDNFVELLQLFPRGLTAVPYFRNQK
ncbi:MAG: peptidase U32 family protein [Syntrophomonadaceae bacterium]|jgi:putative protease